MQIVETKNFKELEIILSDFSCDKHCPYCTAKITQWDKVEDDIYTLFMYIGQMKELGYTFHYVTIGGNGEPTLHDYQKLKDLVEMFDDWDIPVKRVLTSGNIFRPDEIDKYNLFVEHNWMFEVTTTSINNDLDREVLGYNHNYFETEAFKKARIRLNYVLLHRNKDTYIQEIQEFSRRYPNIETVALKLLNINTKTGLVDNKLSAWISENAINKTDRDIIANELNANFKYIGEAFDTHSWKMANGREVYFSWKKVKYGLYDLVYYGNKFINYSLEEVKIPEIVPKVYIAARFILNGDRKNLNLSDDFRTKIINSHNLTDFNNTSFISGNNGELKYQYIGPFYNEKASYGDVTSTDCQEVVTTENKLIERCDTFIAYLDDRISPGGITELIYASMLNKRIVIIFKQENKIGYELKTSNWYPITFALGKAAMCKVIKIRDESELTNAIKGIEWEK